MKHPSWVEGLSFGSILRDLLAKLNQFFKGIFRALLIAKTEVKNSRDIAKHLSQSLRHRFERRRVAVREESELEIADSHDLGRAENFYEQGQYVASEEAAIALLKDNPTLIAAYELLGRIYLAKKSYLEAAEVYRYLLKQSPKDDKHWRSLGDTLVGVQDFPEAIKAYRRSLQTYASAETFVSLALAYKALGDEPSAGKALESALDLEPENVQILMLLAENLIRRAEADSAQEVLEQVLAIEPGNMMAREKLMQLKLGE